MTRENDWFDDGEYSAEQVGSPRTVPTEHIDTSTTHSSLDDQDLRSGQEPAMTTDASYYAEAGTTYSTAEAAQPTPSGKDRDQPTHAPGTAPPARPKGPRMPTVAWGLVLVLLGLVVIAVGLGVDLQLDLVFIGILALAGLTVLIGAIVGAGKKDK